MESRVGPSAAGVWEGPLALSSCGPGVRTFPTATGTTGSVLCLPGVTLWRHWVLLVPLVKGDVTLPVLLWTPQERMHCRPQQQGPVPYPRLISPGCFARSSLPLP